MSKLTIGIGEDFPVEDKSASQAGDQDCRARRGRHRHGDDHRHDHHGPHHGHDHHDHHHGELHARIHRWMHERFGRRGDDRKKGGE